MDKIIGQNIFIINKYFKQYFKNALKDYQLNSAEALTLLVLYDQLEETHADFPTGFTQEQILEVLHYHKSVLTRTMQSLERKGYVVRKEYPNDNRCHLFTLSNQAHVFLPELFHILKNWNDILLEGVQHKAMIAQEIDKMAENAISHQNGGIIHGKNKEA